jgi:hypothetical protein
VISLDFSSVARWPRTNRWRAAQAETRFRRLRPLCRGFGCLGRRVEAPQERQTLLTPERRLDEIVGPENVADSTSSRISGG